MPRKIKLPLLTILFTVLSTVAIGAGIAMADDVPDISAAKIPLSQAVVTAEQHVNGKASYAEFEHKDLNKIYDVEVVSGAKVFNVKVDAENGNVISAVEDTQDSDEVNGKED